MTTSKHSGRVRWTGTLAAPEFPPAAHDAPDFAPEVESHPASALVAAAQRVHEGEDAMAEVLSLFRQARMWMEVASAGEGHVVTPVRAQGFVFLPVFSSEWLLARFCQASGRGAQGITYGCLTGAEVLDELLPELGGGTGIMLDATADHVLALPAASGVESETLGV